MLHGFTQTLKSTQSRNIIIQDCKTPSGHMPVERLHEEKLKRTQTGKI